MAATRKASEGLRVCKNWLSGTLRVLGASDRRLVVLALVAWLTGLLEEMCE